MRKLSRWVVGTVIVMGLGWAAHQTGIFGSFVNSQATASIAEATIPSSNAVYRLAAIERRPIIERVSATGSLYPVALVSVSSQVSGQVKEIYADFNDEVRKGDPIALIDPLSFNISVEQARAQVGMARASVQKAEVTLRDAEADYARKGALATRGTGSKLDATKAEAVRDLATAQREDASHALLGAEAALKQAQADLDRTIVRAPVDGIVTIRSIEVGQTVAVSLQAPVLFTIAQDLRQMQVNASVTEAEIGRIHLGQRFEFTVDAYPGRLFVGEIVQIRMHPQTTQNVVNYTVVASAPNPDLLLMPGMTATANVIIVETEPELTVVSAALRFRPPGERRTGEPGLYIYRNDQAVRVPVQIGPTDGAFTVIRGEGLDENSQVILGLADRGRQEPAARSGGILGLF